VNALLETRGLEVTIGQRPIVRNMELSLNPGECLAVLGRNGAGKSTLLVTLAGLRAPAAGEVRLGGDDLAALHPREVALRRGWLGQIQADPFASTVLETLLTGRHPHLGRWAWEGVDDLRIAREALAAVGLAGFEQRQMPTLSGGERQRVALATLLTQQPLLFLLDEPLVHLDLNHQIAVLELFAGAARDCGAAVVMVLHDPGLAWRYCARTLLLHGAGEFELGNSADLLTAEKLSRLYGHPLRTLEDKGQRWFVPA
jgi:iron complex transport system ATP-binding protein